MGIIQLNVPEQLVIQLKEASDIKCFVETGTYLGKSARWAAEKFDVVFSIEQSPQYFAAAKDALSSLSNVTLLLGDSRTQLPGICSDFPSRAIFWLDAHWSGDDTAGEENQCPLLDEIAAINSRGQSDIILIDDARLFTKTPVSPHRISNWPSLDEVIFAFGRDFKVQVIEDVFVAVPRSRPTEVDVVNRYAKEVAEREWSEYLSKVQRPKRGWVDRAKGDARRLKHAIRKLF